MTDKVIENNQVVVMGEIVSDFVFSHEIFGEGFYMVDVNVPRLSDSSDVIPLMVSERLLDVQEDYKSDYIPCICWGRNARFASNFSVGTRCEIWGRIQSREYMKRISDDDAEKRVAYEVSVSKLELVEE